MVAFHSPGVSILMLAQGASSATLASSPHAEMAACAIWLLLPTRWTLSATAAWATRTDCASLPPITCALAPHVETEARANSPASTITSVNAHQAGQVRPQSSFKWGIWEVWTKISNPDSAEHILTLKRSYSLGKNCQQADPCASNPCANGGQCSPFDFDYLCHCTPFFSGQTCKQDVNECAQSPSPCKNGGVCENEVGTYRCNCPAEYTGKHCETLYQPCNPSPCYHGGTCVQKGETSYECSCLPGRHP